MKRILFDLTACQPSETSKRHGGGRYGEVVISRILDLRMPVCCYYDSGRWINPSIIKRLQESGTQLYDLQQCTLEEIIHLSNPSLLYTPVINKMRGDNQIDCRILFTWHGLRDEEMPLDSFFWKYKNTSWRERLLFLLKKWLPSIGYKKKRIENLRIINSVNKQFVMVSQHSHYSLLSYYPEASKLNIPVFYSPNTSVELSLKRQYADKYFLIVSGNRWFKNGLRAIIALDRLISAGLIEDYYVKVTGAKDASIFRYKLKNPERFTFMGYVEDFELEQLYHDAFCLIYPSLNEGFGYPPIEAMHYGVPVIASPLTSIPEICGAAAMYANPFSIEEIMARILQMTEPQVHQHYEQLSLKQYSLVKDKQEKDLDAFINFIYKEQD